MRIRIASAGTGKTSSLVQRYLDLIEQGIPLRRIAGVTFTRNAAAELRQRVGEGIARRLADDLSPEQHKVLTSAQTELSGATLSTIHGFMAELLRLHAPVLGLDPQFRAREEWEATAAFEQEVSSLLYLAADPEHPLHQACAGVSGLSEKLGLLFAQRSLATTFEFAPEDGSLAELYQHCYDNFLKQWGGKALAPSEIEKRALRLLNTVGRPGRLLERYRLVLIDELQDLNPSQGRFFAALEQAGLQLEAVGDPKQSIYGFRHADLGVFRQALDAGERLSPLSRSYRHAQLPLRFLTRLSEFCAQRGLAYSPDEAPEVSGERRERGGVEIHHLSGALSLDELRRAEAGLLVSRLQEQQRQGIPFDDMAILFKSHASGKQLLPALAAANIPHVLLQGKGYYRRVELRDLSHALNCALDPRGLSLAAFLRGPFAGLELSAIERVMTQVEPLPLLAAEHPEVMATLKALQARLTESPVELLRFALHAPIITGRTYAQQLSSRARQNCEQLLVEVAQRPQLQLQTVLTRLETMMRIAETGDMPQSGGGVKLLTIHRAKGLEWPLVAVFDCARANATTTPELLVAPGSGQVSSRQSAAYQQALAELRQREAAEFERLFYVAASRARDYLIVTASCSKDQQRGWAPLLSGIKVGPRDPDRHHEGLLKQTHVITSVPEDKVLKPKAAPGLKEAPHSSRVFTTPDTPSLRSPSHKLMSEPLDQEPDEDISALPRVPRIIGTLLHQAIGRNWPSDAASTRERLTAQALLRGFGDEERQAIITRVLELLANYEAMLGHDLPALAARTQDRAELPLTLRDEQCLWSGVIDRLYQIDGDWVIEDYKTDKDYRPELYTLQLAIYAKAVQQALGVKPKARLVYLSQQQTHEFSQTELEAAFANRNEAQAF